MLQKNPMSANLRGVGRHGDTPTAAEFLSVAWSYVRRQYLLVLTCLLVAIPAGIAYLMIAPPSYTASASLLIDTRRGQFSPDRAVIGDTPIDATWIETQLAVLVSDSVLTSVVERLQPVQPDDFDTSLGRAVRSFAARALHLAGRDNLNRDPPTASEVTQRAVNALQRQVQVKRNGLSWIIEITVRSSSPELAARVANAIADAYIRTLREGKIEAVHHASDWLRDRLQTLREQSSAAENAAIDFKAKNNIVAISGTLMNDQQLAELNTQLIAARADAATTQARLNRIEAVLRTNEPDGAIGATVSDALNNPIMTRLRTQYLESASREADYAARYGPNHAAVINLRNQLADLRASMRSELGRIAETYKSEHLIAKERQEQVEKRVADQIAKSQEVSQTEVTLRQLESTAESYRTLHNMLLQRYNESQLSLLTDDARVISPASPPSSPSNPNPLLIGVITILGGLGAGAGLAFLRELLDNVFRTVDSVSAAIGAECIAVVPALKAGRYAPLGLLKRHASSRLVYPPILRSKSKTRRFAAATRTDTALPHFTEAMRAVRLALATNKKMTGDTVIGITSSLPGEGKSTIAACLARSLAQMGARTILVDADLRKPTLSRSLVPEARMGLMEVIRGESVLDDAIWTDPDTNLHFLPYVVRIPAPPVIDIFCTCATERLFKRLHAEYDYVLVDLCPLSPVIDVRSTTDLCDSYLFVVEWGRTKIEVVKHSLATAPRVWEKLVGAVLNRADLGRLDKFDRNISNYDGEYFRTYRDVEIKPIEGLCSVAANNISPLAPQIQERTI